MFLQNEKPHSVQYQIYHKNRPLKEIKLFHFFGQMLNHYVQWMKVFLLTVFQIIYIEKEFQKKLWPISKEIGTV